MTVQGTSRSLKSTAAKSVPSGAPGSAAAASSAVTPGTISTAGARSASHDSSARLAMP